jgi:hypothetical protein
MRQDSGMPAWAVNFRQFGIENSVRSVFYVVLCHRISKLPVLRSPLTRPH